ncbi:putative Dihydrolipoamide acetyltransferase component of pyruvate dehydrogenase complex [Vibrio nigripulchritudo SOn1]|uniref:Dihydrolipoamide acetyltransferase component of pyruvate dehydrogenase complex n=1 Tax=Vibrio nigripulchritudo SOn1 TaxID=1238450 RepID=A0AAV2VS33_9VIBR|nr:dihydrolipoamide acetyltransferase family protein [Vibrio nigripulchritudo]CCO47270.1 putative Dihydrolipoamide acetyltransferase component of pyruvate dehydrogenase complex [Vibrio nigripulchritudo SOn1]
MATPVLMPQVGQDLEEGTLTEWMVAVGDTVKKGDVVAVVESEKASFEVETYQEGVVLELLYEEGDTTTVLEPIMYIGDPDEVESPEQAEPQAEAVPAANNTSDVQSSAGTKAQPQSSTESVNHGQLGASPLARRMAANRNIDLTAVSGSGPGGAVLERDLADAEPSSDKEYGDQPYSKVRQVIADRMSESKQTKPHFYLRTEVDVTDLLVKRNAYNQSNQDKVSINDLVIFAVSRQLKHYGKLNSHVFEDHCTLLEDVHIGMAVSVDEGLLVPVIDHADRKSLKEINQASRSLAESARNGVIKSKARGSFTISNMGKWDVELLPIINPPETAILGVGAINKRACCINNELGWRDFMVLTLSADHRAVDGVYGAEFMMKLKESITNMNV